MSWARVSSALSVANDYAVSDFATGFLSVGVGDGALGPYGLAFDSTGQLFVSQLSNNELHRFPSWGGVAGPSTLQGQVPGGLAGLAFAQGRLYAALLQAGQVVELDPGNGQVLRVVAADLSCPSGLAYDANTDQLFVSSLCSGYVLKISSLSAGQPTMASLAKAGPGVDGLAWGSDGMLYAATMGGLARINAQGQVSLLANQSASNGIALAPASDLPLAAPYAYLARSNGKLLRLDVAANPALASTVAIGTERLGHALLGPDGCLFVALPDRIVRIAQSNGGCGMGPTRSVTPVVNIGVFGHPAGRAPLALRFDASESRAMGSASISSYAWDFGDGSVASGSQATHVYALAGTFTAQVTVIDSLGRQGIGKHRVEVAETFVHQDFSATKFVTGIPVARAFAFDTNGDFVFAEGNRLYRLPAQGGDKANAQSLPPMAFSLGTQMVIDRCGRALAANVANSTILQFDPSTGLKIRDWAQTFTVGYCADPLSSMTFGDQDALVFAVPPPGSQISQRVLIADFAAMGAAPSGSYNDGIVVAPNGDIFVANKQKGVLRVRGWRQGGATQVDTIISGLGPDGLALEMDEADEYVKYVYIDSIDDKLWQVELAPTGRELKRLLIRAGGTSGDFAITDPEGCVCFTEDQVAIWRLRKADGTCRGIPQPGAPLIRIKPDGPLHVQAGQSAEITAQVFNTTGMQLGKLRFEVTGSHPQSFEAWPDAQGRASVNLSGLSAGVDQVVAKVLVSAQGECDGADLSLNIASQPLELRWLQNPPLAAGTRISAPLKSHSLGGDFTVQGIAREVGPMSWVLEYGRLTQPATFVTLASGNGEAEGSLALVNSSAWASGTYTLRLRSTDMAGAQRSSETLVSKGPYAYLHRLMPGAPATYGASRVGHDPVTGFTYISINNHTSLFKFDTQGGQGGVVALSAPGMHKGLDFYNGQSWVCGDNFLVRQELSSNGSNFVTKATFTQANSFFEDVRYFGGEAFVLGYQPSDGQWGVIVFDAQTLAFKRKFGQNTFNDPMALDIEADGSVWVTDVNKVYKFNANGSLARSVNFSGRARGIVADPARKLIHLNSEARYRLEAYDYDSFALLGSNCDGGSCSSQSEGYFALPYKLRMDSLGHLIGGDSFSGWGQVFEPKITGLALVTPTPLPSFTSTVTPSVTPSMTATQTGTASPSQTATATLTQSATETATVTATATATLTASETASVTATETATETATVTITATETTTVTATSTATATFTQTEISSDTVTASVTQSATGTPSELPTQTESATELSSATMTITLTLSATPSVTSSASGTPSATAQSTFTFTATRTSTRTATLTATLSGSPSFTPARTASRTATLSLTKTPTAAGAVSPSPTPQAGSPSLCLAWAIQATQGQSIHNGATLVDSYRSSLGAYGGANRFANGAVRAGLNILQNGGAVIQGSLAPNSPQALTPWPTPQVYIYLGNLNIQGKQVYTLAPGDYVADSINFNGTPRFTVSGSSGVARVWFKNLNIAGTVGVGATQPGRLQFLSLPGAGQVNINGTSQVYAVIFAPNIPVQHNGTGGFFGAIVGSSVTLNGNASLHYDQDLACPGSGSGGLLAHAGEPKRHAQTIEPGALLLAPNPARDLAWARFALASAVRARLRAFDLVGQQVLTLELGQLGQGDHQVSVSTQGLASGIFIMVLEVDQGLGFAPHARFKWAVTR